MREHPLKIIKSTPLISSTGFGIFLISGQSAGNHLFFMGSSETSREASPSLDFWLIGFAEGDGSFIVNKDGSLEFKITQSSNDAQILFYIKNNLGFGSVSKQDSVSNTHHFRVRESKFLMVIYF